MKILISPYLFTTVAALLLIATFDLPYFYYELLRLVVCSAFCWIAFLNQVYDDENLYLVMMLISIAFAILFNPFMPIYLNKETWILLDIASALYIFTNGIIVTRRISSE